MRISNVSSFPLHSITPDVFTMKYRFLFVWLFIPIGCGLLYPFVKDNPQFLEWLTIGLGISILFFSVVIHELCHGLAAYWCGDLTAKDAGRLTLNPINHISLVGTLIVPLALYLTRSSMLFGWAKPVPFNPLNVRQHPRDQVMIAIAGPLANFTLAYLFFNFMLVAVVIFKGIYPETAVPATWDVFSPLAMPDIRFEAFWFVLLHVLSAGMVLNVVLGVFNLIPFPPLDGSWIVKALLPKRAVTVFGKVQQFGFIFLIVAMHFHLLEVLFYPAILIIALFQLIAGFYSG